MRISDWSSDVCSADLDLGEQAVRDRRTSLQPAQQVLVGERGERGVGDGGDGGGARARVEERELTEHGARTEDGQEVLATVRGGSAAPHLDLGDEVKLVAEAPFVAEARAPPTPGTPTPPPQ